MPPAFYALPSLPVPLGEQLHLLRITGTLYCRGELTAPWGLDIPQLDEVMSLIVVTAGEAWLELDGAAPLLLRPGGLALLPRCVRHLLRSSPQAPVEPLFDLPVERVSERYEILRHGGGGSVTQATYASMRVDHVATRRLISQLPPVIHLEAWSTGPENWLQGTLQLIGREAAVLRPGGETVITRLADVLVVQAIREWLDRAPEAQQGWLAALRDERIGRALAGVHRNPELDWNLDLLAQRAGMSRSVFSARFTELVGEPAMRYVTRWRLQVAYSQLQHSDSSLAAIAHQVGYRSEAAFCRAFKREFGIPPGVARRGSGA